MIETLIWAWRAFRTTAAFRWLALAAGAVGGALIYLSRRDARVRREERAAQRLEEAEAYVETTQDIDDAVAGARRAGDARDWLRDAADRLERRDR